MKKGIVCFSFDDGRKDNREVAELLLSKNIPATFNITSGYVDGTCPKELLPCGKEAMNIEDVCWLNEQRIFEVALHGNNHLNTAEDIKEGRRKIIEWLNLPNDSVLGFASPGTGIDFALLEKEKELFYQDISYVRVSLQIKTMRYLRIVARKIARVIHSPFLYKIAYKDTLMKKNEVGKIVHSVPVMRDITIKEVKALVDMCVKQGKVLVLMFHSIEDKVEEKESWTWEKRKFIELCQYVNLLERENRLTVMTVQELYNEKN